MAWKHGVAETPVKMWQGHIYLQRSRKHTHPESSSHFISAQHI